MAMSERRRNIFACYLRHTPQGISPEEVSRLTHLDMETVLEFTRALASDKHIEKVARFHSIFTPREQILWRAT